MSWTAEVLLIKEARTSIRVIESMQINPWDIKYRQILPQNRQFESHLQLMRNLKRQI